MSEAALIVMRYAVCESRHFKISTITMASPRSAIADICGQEFASTDLCCLVHCMGGSTMVPDLRGIDL